MLNRNAEFLERFDDVPLTVPEWMKQREIYRRRDEPGLNKLDLGFATFYLNRTNRSGVLRGGIIGGLKQEGTYKLDARFNKFKPRTRSLRVTRSQRATPHPAQSLAGTRAVVPRRRPTPAVNAANVAQVGASGGLTWLRSCLSTMRTEAATTAATRQLTSHPSMSRAYAVSSSTSGPAPGTRRSKRTTTPATTSCPRARMVSFSDASRSSQSAAPGLVSAYGCPRRSSKRIAPTRRTSGCMWWSTRRTTTPRSSTGSTSSRSPASSATSSSRVGVARCGRQVALAQDCPHSAG